MITQEKFLEMVMEDIKEYLPKYVLEECNITKMNVMKNNDCELTGICFVRADGFPCPVFYVEGAYGAYCKGEDYDHILKDLASSVVNSWVTELPITIDGLDYEKIKDKLTFQIVDMRHNRNMMKNCVHTELGNDLAMVYRIEYKDKEHIMRTLVTNDLAKENEYDIETLVKDAKENMEKLYPARLSGTRESILELITEESPKNLLDATDIILDEPLYVLTTSEIEYGAAALFYEGVQEKIGNMARCNYYVIPSSPHEFMIVPASVAPPVSEMLKALEGGNKLAESRQDFLSDRLFMYDRGIGKLAEVSTPNRGKKIEMER